MSEPSTFQNIRLTLWSAIIVSVLTLLVSILSLYHNYNRLMYMREQTERRMEMKLERDKMRLEQAKQQQWLDIQCGSLQSDFGATPEISPEEQ